MTAPLENPEVDLTLLSAARTLGAAISFLVAWFCLILWKHSLGPIFEAIGNTGFGGVYGVGALKPLHFLVDASHAVENFLTGVMAGCERSMIHSFGAILWSFYDLAFTTVKIAYDTWGAVNRIYHAGTKTVTKVVTNTVVKPVRTTVRTAVAVTKQQFNALTHRVDGIAARVSHLAHVVAAMSAAAGHAIANPFPRIKAAEHDLTNLGKRVKKLEKLIGAGVGLALLTKVLGKVMVGALRCDRNKQLLKGTCHTDKSWVDEFLAGSILLFGTTSFVEFVKEAQAGFDLGVEGLQVIIREFNSLDIPKG